MRARCAAILACLAHLSQRSSAAPEQLKYELLPYNPVAAPAAVVAFGGARFTILTPRLIRMEYSPSNVFEDRASLAFVNRCARGSGGRVTRGHLPQPSAVRAACDALISVPERSNLPVPPFNSSASGGVLTLATSALKLRYSGGNFSASVRAWHLPRCRVVRHLLLPRTICRL